MHLAFEAQEVLYNEALGGDIIQVSFQEFPDPDIDYSKKNFKIPPPIKYLSFSVNYEYSHSGIIVEWCDGERYDGQNTIKEIHLTKTSLAVILANSFSFEINFKTDDLTFKNIKTFLSTNENQA